MKSRTQRLAVGLAGGALAALLASGCSWSIGGKKTESSVHPQPAGTAPATRGQELMDLKKARDQGAINEEEYQALRKKLLEKE
jgi:hypothetical protein